MREVLLEAGIVPTIEECAAAMDDVASERCDLFGALPAFVERFEDDKSDVVVAAACAIDYGLFPRRQPNGSQSDNPFVPAFGSPEEHFQRIKEADEGAMLRIWADLAVHVRNPVTKARLHDLLWVTRHGDNPHRHARAAIEAYLVSAKQDACAGHAAIEALDRSLALSASLNATEHLQDITRVGLAQLDHQQQQPEASRDLTVVTAALRLLVALPPEHRPISLADRIADAHDAFSDEDMLGKDALFKIEQELAGGDAEAIQRIRHRATQAWTAEADRQERWHRVHALEQVEKWAQGTTNASDLVAGARRARQEMESGVFQWAEINVSADIPTADIERELARVVGEDNVELALLRFGGWGPPTGNPAEIADAVAREAETSRLMDIIPEALHHPSGFEVKTFTTAEEKHERRIKRHQEFHARIHGDLAAEALTRIGAAYPRRWGGLATFFASDLIWPPEAHAFSRAFEHFWAGRYDEAILVALPRIEAILRRTARALGGVVFRPPEANRPGGLKTLGEVLRLLQGKVDDGWWQSFWFVLADPIGLNLRNEYSHGLRDEGDAIDAALVLQLAAHLRLRTLEPTTASSEQSANDG